MYTKYLFSLALVSALITLQDAARESIDGGFGPNIKWYNSLEEGILAAQSDMRPIMVIVHRSWCPACKKLKPELVNSREYFDLSQYFVMVNLDDESDAQDAKRLVPDGGYVPRILFLDWNGELRPEFWNKYGSGKYKYYHSSAQTVTSLMRSALEYFTPISDYYKQQYYQQLQQQQPQYQPYQQYQQYAYQPVEQINSDL
nr:PREDICTED: thioredoxin domain-containing protein 12-like isoform X1 [Bemisia tabaci]